MRILLINQYFPPDASATAYLIGELSEDLAATHEVWIIAGRPSYNADRETFRPRSVRLVRAWSTTFARTSLAGRALNYSTFLLTAFLRSLLCPRPDVIVAFTDPPVVGLIGLIAARRHGAPLVYACMDIFPDVSVALGVVHSPIAVRLWGSVNRLQRRGSSRIVAIGRDMVEKLEAEGVPSNKVVFIPNWGVEPPPLGDVEIARTQMGWHGRRVVMHAGNIGLAQNLGVVLDAAEILLQRSPDVLFVLMGDGAARNKLQLEARRRRLSNVAFLDHLPKEDAQTSIAAADLHLVSLAPGLRGSVVPSKVYGLLAASMPFVAAVDEDSEIHRIIIEYGCGSRVAPGDGAQLAHEIIALSSEDLSRMGQSARRAFEERYTRLRATRAYGALLEEVALGSRGAR